jgi:hypothetical protein
MARLHKDGAWTHQRRIVGTKREYRARKELFSKWCVAPRIGSNADEILYTNKLQFPSLEREADASVPSNFCVQKHFRLFYHRFTSQLRETL